ncbi:MAG: hypothetical protein M1594_01910, partial [Candidatus Marsarchaeota archaeon]|nr:hypothetical protein [Candidatus Marsarchaeota archaeon]
MEKQKNEIQKQSQDYVTKGKKIWGLNVNRSFDVIGEMDRIASSKNSAYKKKLFSNLLVKSGHYTQEHADKIAEILSARDNKTIIELQKILALREKHEPNKIVESLTGNKLISFRGKRVEDMLKENYNDVSKAFVNELHKSDFFMNKIEQVLKPTQAFAQPLQEQFAAQAKPKKPGEKQGKKGSGTVYNVKNYGSIGNVGKNIGGKFVFKGVEVGQPPEQQENYNKMMESLLEYNKNISDHLKALKQELGKPVERAKGGFKITGFKKPEKPESKKEREAEQLGLGLKEKPVEGQLELPFNKLKNLIEEASKNPEFENLRNLYNFNSKPARKEFDKIIFENQSGDEAQYNALKILLKNRDFNRMARAVKSENWGFSKLQALERIGSTINDSNKDEAIKIFSDLLKEKEVDEYYLTIHKTLDKVRDEKTRKYIFEKIKPSLLEAEGKMKSAVFDQLKSVFIAGGEQNNVVKTLLRNW